MRRLSSRRARVVPAVVAALLEPEERVLAVAALRTAAGSGVEPDATAGPAGRATESLVATRFGLWWVSGDSAVRWEWHRISKAVLADSVLSVTVAEQLMTWPDGIQVAVDMAPRAFPLADRTGLTDAVHSRVRSSVVAAEHLPYPGAGGWLVLRRVAGQDGLTAQVRLDRGVDADVPGFREAASAGLAGLRGQPLGG